MILQTQPTGCAAQGAAAMRCVVTTVASKWKPWEGERNEARESGRSPGEPCPWELGGCKHVRMKERANGNRECVVEEGKAAIGLVRTTFGPRGLGVGGTTDARYLLLMGIKQAHWHREARSSLI
jgi:hypothetical protein